MAHLGESFISHLLRPLCNKTLHIIKLRAHKLEKKTHCMISYAWPLTKEEEGMQERILQMCDDFVAAGIEAYMDITKADSTTKFEESLPQWISSCDVVVLVGSTSYPLRSNDPLTLTHLEAIEIGKKKKINPNSIIPVLFEGRFGSSYPPGFQDTIGGRFVKPIDYIKEIPGVAASILGVSKDPEVAKKLSLYHDEALEVIKNAKLSDKDLEQAALIAVTQRQYWTSRLIVLTSQFSLNQLRWIDGNVVKNTSVMDHYCTTIISEFQSHTASSLSRDLPSSLTQQWQYFLASEEKRMLLLCTSPPLVPHLFAHLAMLYWNSESHSVPVIINLSKLENASEDCVFKSLLSQGLTRAAIKQAKQERSFLFLICGFEEGNVCTNVYMRSELYTWPGKVVATISPECMELSPSIPLFFTPCTTQTTQLPDGDSLQIVTFDSKDVVSYPSTSLSFMSLIESLDKSTQPTEQPNLVVQLPEKKNASPPKSAEAVSKLDALEQKTAEEHTKGFKLLQRDIVRIECHKFLARISSFTTPSNAKLKAFISYAWPQDPLSRDQLQGQLLDLVDDLSHAGINTLLDIMQLQPGSDVKQFMESEIRDSNTVLWIGTPDLKARVKFDEKGNPTTNAAVEFEHICRKSSITLFPPSTASSIGWSIQALWFRGNSVSDAFPEHQLSVTLHNYTNNTNYYTILPQLVASFIGIADNPQFTHAYAEYCNNVELWEASFTPVAIHSRLELDKLEALSHHEASEMKLKELLANVPESYIKAQVDADEAKTQVLLSSLVHLKQVSLSPGSPHAQSLEYYVPLELGTQQDTKPEDRLKALDTFMSFLFTSDLSISSVGLLPSSPVMLLHGAAGSGKSLFARYLECYLWRQWNNEQLSQKTIIPVFVSLPLLFSLPSSRQASATNEPHQVKDLAGEALTAMGFTGSEFLKLSTTVQLLFILDGLDEVALDTLPPKEFLNQTHLSSWIGSNSKVVVTCRTQHIPILESKIGQSIDQYFSTSSPPITFHLMPFNTSQITQFLTIYSQSLETRHNSTVQWTAQEYDKHINNIRGLPSLVQNPFLLKLVVKILPELSKRKNHFSVNSSHVYREFSNQLFYRESWKRMTQEIVLLKRDLPSELRELSERLSLRLYNSNSIALPIDQLNCTDQDLITSTPTHITIDGQVRFIHKSVQEFFVSQKWISCLDTGNKDQLVDVLNTNFVSREAGVLAFTCQQIYLPYHSNKLLEVVTESRNNKGIAIGASNAISILNQSRFSFSYLDLSSISIPEADLRYATMEATNLSNSDLSGCLLQQAWMKQACLQNCQMEKCQLGELPWIDLKSEAKIPLCIALANEKIVVGFQNGVIEVWDMTTRQQIGKPLLGHIGKVTSVVVSCGKIISGSSDNSIRIWDMASMQSIGSPLRGHTHWVKCIAVGDGKIASGSTDKTIFVWDLTTMQQISQPLHSHNEVVNGIAIADGMIVSGSKDCTVRIWDLNTMCQIENGVMFVGSGVSCVAIHEGKIAFGSLNIVGIWDVATRQRMSNLLGHTSDVNCVAISDGKIVSGSKDKTLRVWDLATMQQIGDPLRGHTGEVLSVAVLDGKIASASDDATIRIWDMPSLSGSPLQVHTDWVLTVAVWEDRIVSGSKDNTIRIWDITTMQQIGAPLQGHTGWVSSLATSDNILVSGGYDMTMRVWDKATMKQISDPIQGTIGWVTCVAVCDGKLVAGSSNRTIQVWDLNTRQQIGELLGHRDNVTSIAVYGRIIISGSYDTTVRVWDITTMHQIGELQGHTGDVTCVAMLGDRIVSGSADKSLRVWDVAIMQQVGILQGHTGGVTSVALANENIISGSWDNTIRVWDMKTMKQIGKEAKGDWKGVICMALSENGKRVIAGCGDDAIRSWDISSISMSFSILPYLCEINNHSAMPTLIHCSHRLSLCFEGCNVEGAKGLSAQQMQVVNQRGATGAFSNTEL